MQLVATVGLLIVFWISGSQAAIKPGSSIECFTDLGYCNFCGPQSKGTEVRRNCVDFCNQCDADRQKKNQVYSFK